MQRYLDNIKTKTGKNINDFREMAEKKGLIKSRDIVAWLTDEFAMENVYAQAWSVNSYQDKKLWVLINKRL